MSLEDARRVDEVCDEFEARLKRGDRPQIEQHLDAAPDPLRRSLLRELVRLEVEYCERRGRTANLQEYALRFPHDRDVLLEAFGRDAAETEGRGEMRTAAWLPEFPLRRASHSAIDDAFGGYEILDEVGRGGMGVVYRARHRILDKIVALKLLQPNASSQRFLREARLLARVQSPHVVAVHDFRVLSDDRPLIVMEWVDGRNLSTVIKQEGALPEATAVEWMKQTCLGMTAACSAGIVHRDLKPSNILIDLRHRARVTDFGLAKDLLADPSHSLTNEVFGTPFYMSPEQAENARDCDERSDIYSLGATFYHALTGRVPFTGESPFSVLYKHKTSPLVSPRSVQSTLSPHISEVLERCLAKSRGDRYQSFQELHAQLATMSASPWDLMDSRLLLEHQKRFDARRYVYLHRPDELGVGDVYQFPDGRTLTLLCGDLVEQQVDAIVSSDDDWISMGGGVSAAIRMQGGSEIQEEAQKFTPVMHGRAVVTSAGTLPSRFVFHAVTLSFGDESEDWRVVWASRDLILELVNACFYHADTLKLTSLAFPLLGTGAARLSRETCLETMFQSLSRLLLSGLTCVRDVRIVIWPEESD